jgi:hypothetical protein
VAARHPPFCHRAGKSRFWWPKSSVSGFPNHFVSDSWGVGYRENAPALTVVAEPESEQSAPLSPAKQRLADAKRRREAARPDLSRSMISGRHFRSSEPCDVRFRALPLRPSAQVRVAGIESLERLALHTLPGAEVSKG